MALTPQNEDAFFREVDEELRRDQIGSFWRRYGKLVALALALGLAVLAGVLWWQHQQRSKAGIAGEQMARALIDLGAPGKDDAARAALGKLAQSPIDGYAALAKLTLAAAALEKGDTKAAVEHYRAVAADADTAQPFRDLALIRRTAIEFDTLPPAQVVERLKPLAVSGGAWFGSAGEMVAVAYMKMNRPELAGPIFAAMAKDQNVPETVRTRALRLAGLLGVDAVAQPAGTAGE